MGTEDSEVMIEKGFYRAPDVIIEVLEVNHDEEMVKILPHVESSTPLNLPFDVIEQLNKGWVFIPPENLKAEKIKMSLRK